MRWAFTITAISLARKRTERPMVVSARHGIRLELLFASYALLSNLSTDYLPRINFL